MSDVIVIVSEPRRSVGAPLAAIGRLPPSAVVSVSKHRARWAAISHFEQIKALRPTAMLWWRTVARDLVPPQLPAAERTTALVATGDQSLWTETLRRRLVPALLPVISIEDKNLGGGLNISFVPKIPMKGKVYSVNTLIMQMTWAL